MGAKKYEILIEELKNDYPGTKSTLLRSSVKEDEP